MHISTLLENMDLMKRPMQIKRLLEMAVLVKTSEQRFLNILESKMMYYTVYQYLSDIFEIVEITKQSEMFSLAFYNHMFDKTVQMMKISGSS